jgi:hypothetical protein
MTIVKSFAVRDADMVYILWGAKLGKEWKTRRTKVPTALVRFANTARLPWARRCLRSGVT